MKKQVAAVRPKEGAPSSRDEPPELVGCVPTPTPNNRTTSRKSVLLSTKIVQTIAQTNRCHKAMALKLATVLAALKLKLATPKAALKKLATLQLAALKLATFAAPKLAVQSADIVRWQLK